MRPAPRGRARRATRSSRRTAPTRPTSSTTSTPTGSRTASWSTRSGTPRWPRTRPPRWARRGATGTPWTTWPTPRHVRPRGRASSTRRASPTSGSATTSRSARSVATAIRFQAIDCPVGSADGANCHSPHAGVPAGGLHVRQPRQDRRRARGALGRRDLGADAVGSPHRGRAGHRPTAGHARDGAVAGRPVVPRHAQRDPPGRHVVQRRRRPRNTIWAVFAHRGMGYFAGTIDAADTHPVASFATPPAANAPQGTLSGSVIDLQTHAPGARRPRRRSPASTPGSPAEPAPTTSRHRQRTGCGACPPAPTRTWSPTAPATSRLWCAASRSQPGRTVRNLKPRRGWALLSGGGNDARPSRRPTSPTSAAARPALIDGCPRQRLGPSIRRGRPITVKLPAEDQRVRRRRSTRAPRAATPRGQHEGLLDRHLAPTASTSPPPSAARSPRNQGGHINTLLPPSARRTCSTSGSRDHELATTTDLERVRFSTSRRWPGPRHAGRADDRQDRRLDRRPVQEDDDVHHRGLEGPGPAAPSWRRPGRDRVARPPTPPPTR